MTDPTPDFVLRPVKFSRLAGRGILLGLTVPQLITASVAVTSIIFSLYFAGAPGLAWTSPVWVTSAAGTWLPVGGRPAILWLPVAGHWFWRSARKQTSYRKRVATPRPTGTLALPGDAAALREWEDPETGAVMIQDPYGQTLTAILEVTHPSFILLDPIEQQRRVTGWGRVLATTCRSGRIARLQVLERTLPDSGSGLAQWWATHGNDDGSWVATTYRELIERAGPAGERHVSTISLSLDLNAAGRSVRAAGGGMKGAAHVLRQEMTTLTSALRTADLKPSTWYPPRQLAAMLRSAYDPGVAVTLERANGVGRVLADAGPVVVEESWDRLRSDTAFHTVLWISEWPRSLVFPGFLAPVLLTGGITRSFSLICDPIRADIAARDIRKKRTGYISDAHQRAKVGQIEDLRQSAEYDDVLQQDADLTAGHGLLRYTGLIALSAPTETELEAAVATIEQAAIQASCETRRLVGQQAQAFTAAALPLGRGI
ncbi:SCO6880 family protein [Lacisediminihabitans sp. H27-G8]|uniref:SCO6880 family protein n=1 Tax=Lacisediminihabitans sp. H27-G8 TaxID=3111909 RepID=UPI0038FD3DC9